jgi:hypothetical protein
MNIKQIFEKFEQEIRRQESAAAAVDAVLAFEFIGPGGIIHPEQGLNVLKLNALGGPPKVVTGYDALQFRPEKGFDLTYTIEVDHFKQLHANPDLVSDFFFDKKLLIRCNDELEPKVQEALRQHGLA